MNDVLLTPFWTLSEILSIYVSWIVMMVLLLPYFMLKSLMEWIWNLLNN